MTPYNPRHDYCGPSSRCRLCGFLSMMVPRRLWGVDLNRICWEHDQAWADGAEKADDLEFASRLFSAFLEAGKVRRGAIVTLIYYSAVRLRAKLTTTR